MPLLEGKVALITGAKGGLGTSVTEAFLKAGAIVAGVSRSIRDSDFDNPRFFAFPAELTSSDAARTVVEAIVAKVRQVDVLVHLVGAFAGGMPVAETEDSVVDQMFEVNFRSAFFMAKAAIRHMRERSAGGRVLFIGSRAAIEANANAGVYSASKAALLALTRAIASENASAGISANIIMPGTMDTPANRKAMPEADFKRWVHPEQVAHLIVTLASDELSQVSGAAIPVYGSDL
jgi:NAD(P)-dependent dehydrogenase (short-subunit alcohol dehydrogenase family)